MKAAKKIVEKKTPGTLIVEKYRPRMNKLKPAERQRLRNRALQSRWHVDQAIFLATGKSIFKSRRSFQRNSISWAAEGLLQVIP